MHILKSFNFLWDLISVLRWTWGIAYTFCYEYSAMAQKLSRNNIERKLVEERVRACRWLFLLNYGVNIASVGVKFDVGLKISTAVGNHYELSLLRHSIYKC